MADIEFKPGDLHPGDLVLFEGRSFLSRGIKLFTNSRWSHAAIFVGNDFIIEATQAGVEKNQLTPLIKKAAHIAVMRIPDLSVDNMELMKAKAYDLLGDKYDTWQFITLIPYFLLRKIGIIIPALVGDKAGEVVCSGLYAMCAMVIPVKFAKEIKLVTPEILYRSNKLTLAYEG